MKKIYFIFTTLLILSSSLNAVTISKNILGIWISKATKKLEPTLLLKEKIVEQFLPNNTVRNNNFIKIILLQNKEKITLVSYHISSVEEWEFVPDNILLFTNKSLSIKEIPVDLSKIKRNSDRRVLLKKVALFKEMFVKSVYQGMTYYSKIKSINKKSMIVETLGKEIKKYRK